MLSDNPNVISFSSGRSSGYMTHRLLMDHNYRSDAIIVMANTGLEDEESLIFADKCSKLWYSEFGIGVVWLEYARDENRQPTFRIVNFDSASRKGEPFAAMLEERRNLPNLMARYCTQELKVRTIKRYVRSLGIEHWTNVVGIRYDEPRRWSKTSGIADKERFDIDMPMVRWQTRKIDVLNFWKSMPFDLEIEHEMFGNCNLCFLKGKGKKVSILKRRPAVAEFWLKWERATPGYTFHSRYSVQDLIDQIASAPTLFDDEPDFECFCNAD